MRYRGPAAGHRGRGQRGRRKSGPGGVGRCARRVPSTASGSGDKARLGARGPRFSCRSRCHTREGLALMLEYKGYIGTLEAEDGVFFGRVAGFARCDHFRRFDLRRSRASLPRKCRRLSGVLRRARRATGSALQRQDSASHQSGNASSGGDARSIRGAEPQSMDRAADRKWPLSFPGGLEHADAIPYRRRVACRPLLYHPYRGGPVVPEWE